MFLNQVRRATRPWLMQAAMPNLMLRQFSQQTIAASQRFDEYFAKLQKAHEHRRDDDEAAEAYAEVLGGFENIVYEAGNDTDLV